MATVKLIFNEKRITKEGKIPLWIRITKNRKPKYIALGVSIEKKHWDNAEKKVKSSYTNHQYMNNFIRHKLADAEAIALSMETSSKIFTTKKIKQSIMGINDENFIVYFEKWLISLKQQGKIGVFKKDSAILDKLKAFLRGHVLLFADLTVSFLKDYENHLRFELGNSVNTTHANLKVFRTLVNNAVREEIIPPEINPFLRYKLKKENTTPVHLSEEDIKAIEELKLNPYYKMAAHRDMFIFACYAGGLRISDLLLLRWENYDGTRITVKTKKTGEITTIKLPDKAKSLIERYLTSDSQDDDFIFPLLSNHLNYDDPEVLHSAISSATAYANKNLRYIGEMAGIKTKVHQHLSRHSFAVLALKKGMRIEYVSKLMAHSTISQTQHYARIVNEDLEKAMEIMNH